MVEHYKQRGLSGIDWEVGNEGVIGEMGGSPYRFTPEKFVRYYRHTVSAILKSDPTARVGGPAIAFFTSPLMPALLDAAEQEKIPLRFISWHHLCRKRFAVVTGRITMHWPAAPSPLSSLEPHADDNRCT